MRIDRDFEGPVAVVGSGVCRTGAKVGQVLDRSIRGDMGCGKSRRD